MSLKHLIHPGLSVLLLMSLTASGRAQQPPAVPPNPQAPNVAMPFPLGAQPGTTLELTLTGANLAGPTGLWTSFPANVTIPTDNNNGKDNAKLLVRLEVPKEAPLGFHALRLATTRGESNLRLFCIDDLPPVLAVDTNHVKTTPQAVPVPCVVAGRSAAEASDWYKISVKAGQRVSFDVLGHRLGSPIDPQLSIWDARTGHEVPGAHSNDALGCQTDPRLTWTFKEAGDYLVEVRDVMWRGGADFMYRLRIGDFPCATTPVPLAARRGSKVNVTFAGPNVEGVPPVEVTVPADPQVSTVWVAPKGANGLHGWPVALAVSDLDEVVEQEPNNELAKANRIPMPGAVSGRLQQKGDVDFYVFTAKKGQRLLIDAQTVEMGSPTLLYLVLHDAKGADIAKSNPQAAPPLDQRLDFTPPTDGDYVLEAQHLNYLGGPEESYRLTVVPYEPGFNLALGIDRFDVPSGATQQIPVFAGRRDYAGAIELSVVADHPGITGKATMNPGQPPAPNQPGAVVFVSAQPDVPVGPHTIRIVGKAMINGHPVTEYASVRAVVSQNLGGLAVPPPPLTTVVGLAVTEKPPFTLDVKFDQAEALRGGPVAVTITANRAAGFQEEIALTPGPLPANVTAALKNIPKGQNEVKVQLTPAANAALGQFPISVVGKAKVQNKDFTLTSLPGNLVLVLPFELQVPAKVELPVGGKAKVVVKGVRHGGYQGPIDVELKNLPANVTAPKSTLAQGKGDVEIEVTAAANAVPGDKGDVNAQGTAPAAGNQQNASANFTVSVLKK